MNTLDSIWIQNTLNTLQPILQTKGPIFLEQREKIKDILQQLPFGDLPYVITDSALRDLKEKAHLISNKATTYSVMCTARKMATLFERLQLAEVMLPYLPPKEVRKLLDETFYTLKNLQDPELSKLILKHAAKASREEREVWVDRLCEILSHFSTGKKELLQSLISPDYHIACATIIFFRQLPFIADDTEGAIAFISHAKRSFQPSRHSFHFIYFSGFLANTGFRVSSYLELIPLFRKFIQMPEAVCHVLFTYTDKLKKYTSGTNIAKTIIYMVEISADATSLRRILDKTLAVLSSPNHHFLLEDVLKIFSYLPPSILDQAEQVLIDSSHRDPHQSLPHLYDADPSLIELTHNHIIQKVSFSPLLLGFHCSYLLKFAKEYHIHPQTTLFQLLMPVFMFFANQKTAGVKALPCLKKTTSLIFKAFDQKEAAYPFFQAYEKRVQQGTTNTLNLTFLFVDQVSSLQELTKIFEIFNQIPSYLNKDNLLLLRKIFPSDAKGYIPKSIQVISLLLDSAHFAQIIDAILSLHIEKNPSLTFDVLLIMCVFDRKLLPEVFSILHAYVAAGRHIPQTHWEYILESILEFDTPLKKKFHLDLFHRLITSSDFTKTGFLISLIFPYMQAFRIPQDSSLFNHVQTARYHILNHQTPFNPYAIFYRHQAFRSIPHPLAIEKLNSHPDFFFDYQGQRYQKTLLGLTYHPHSYMDIKEIIALWGEKPPNGKTFSHAVHSMIRRVHGFIEPEKQAFLQAVENAFGLSFNDLCQNLLDDFLIRLLTLNPSQPIPLLNAYFVSIVGHALSLSNECREQLWSDQEYALLSNSASIQACSTGKTAGILLTYPLLPAEFRYPLDLSTYTAPQSNTQSWVIETVKKHLWDKISCSSPWMRYISGHQDSAIAEIPQLSHHTIFVQNILGPVFKFNHEVTFDFYTQTLSAALIERPLDEILRSFIYHLSVDEMIDALQRSFLMIPKEKALYTGICELLDKKVPLENLWTLDESTWEPRLSYIGALELLHLFEILTR